MVCSYHLVLACLVLALPTIQGLKYTVTNDAKGYWGGKAFDEIMGEKKATSSMQGATYFVWHKVFEQWEVLDRKQVEEIRLIIQTRMDYVFSYCENDGIFEIHLNSSVFESYFPRNVNSSQFMNRIYIEDKIKYNMNWIVIFGIASALQWTADGAAPEKLRNGIAAVAVLEAHHKPHLWTQVGEGRTWDENYVVMAQFFYYINKRKPHFVANLNKKMRTTYSESSIEEAAGKTIHEWWKIYKEDYHRA